MWKGFYTVDRDRWPPLGEDDCDCLEPPAWPNGW